MIYSVRGTVAHMEQGFAVIECSGVGYRCQTTLSTMKKIKIGSEATLYTYLNVREDAVELYGFYSTSELSCFKTLVSVSGVGPKMALSVLSEFSPEQVAMCVSAGDVKSLTRAQGVGPKLAQRIILELKDKLSVYQQSDTGVETKGSVIADTGNIPKAVAALAVLGYSAADVTPVLSRLDQSLSVTELISETLKRMGR
ncbi:MAG: Holliday junction branch migration protein RuvA [Eubacteriales bacterium]|nr:Holliday junction branch migration protein RuvA [Eubacteriales bacterium]